MATRNPIAQAGPGAQFCDYCHQKPKFSNHSYCSKTCAAQAATLCNYCHKKPKFQNFDYCGKNCASQANPGGVKAAAGNARPPQGPNAQAKPFATGQRGPQQQTKPAFDPMQIAKLVAQQIPQVQALLGPNGLAALGQQQQPAPPPSNNQYAPQPAPPTNRSVNSNSSNPINNPFMNSMNPSSMPMPGPGHSNIPFATNNLQQQQQQQYQQPINADDLECRIPGCGKPVHIDAKGLKTSDYCSQRHREEAVSSGLVSPCIMCLTKPQSHTDYFCGRTCREESLNKRYDPAEETRIEEVEDDEAHFVDPNGNAINNNGQILN